MRFVRAVERQQQSVPVLIGHELETPERPNTHRRAEEGDQCFDWSMERKGPRVRLSSFAFRLRPGQ